MVVLGDEKREAKKEGRMGVSVRQREKTNNVAVDWKRR